MPSKRPKPIGNPKEITFSQLAWLKFVAMRNSGANEVAGFGITGEDPLFIEDFVLVKHHATPVNFDFDDEALGVFQGQMFADGIYPDQCRRISCHTHPGNSATPSQHDMDMFDEHYESMDWAVMVILAHGGQHSALLRIRTTPDDHEASNQALMWIDKPLEVKVKGIWSMDHLSPEELSKLPWQEWMDEYKACNLPKKGKWQGNLSTGNTDGHFRGKWVRGTKDRSGYVEREKAVEAVIEHLKAGNQDKLIANHFNLLKGGCLVRSPSTTDPVWYGIYTDQGGAAIEDWTQWVRAENAAEIIIDLRDDAIYELLGHDVDSDCIDRLVHARLRVGIGRPVLQDCWNYTAGGVIASEELFQARYHLTDLEMVAMRELNKLKKLGTVHEVMERVLDKAVWGNTSHSNNDDKAIHEWTVHLIECDRKGMNQDPLETLKSQVPPGDSESAIIQNHNGWSGGVYCGE